MEKTYTLTDKQLRMFATAVCARYFTALSEKTGTAITMSSVSSSAVVAGVLVDSLELEPYMWDMGAMTKRIEALAQAKEASSSTATVELTVPSDLAAAIKKLLNA